MKFNKIKRFQKIHKALPKEKTPALFEESHAEVKDSQPLMNFYGRDDDIFDAGLDIVIEDESQALNKAAQEDHGLAENIPEHPKAFNANAELMPPVGSQNGHRSAKLSIEKIGEGKIKAPTENSYQPHISKAKAILEKILKIKKSVGFVNSIIEPVQTLELKNHLIGKLARLFCIYKVNEIFVYNDEAFAKDKRDSGFDPTEFIVKILQYLETPQYLRKRLFPISSLLKNVGLLVPLECQHHLKATDVSEYREGVVLKRPTKENEGSWVDVGLKRVY